MVDIGPLSLNIAFISLPVLLISIYKLAPKRLLRNCHIIIIIIAIILFLQPDASMLTAFFIALIPFYYISNNKFWKYSWVILLILSYISWVNLDNLVPVPYVEDIIILAINESWIYLIFCVFSFVVMLWPFFKWKKCTQCKEISIALGLFYLVLILSTILGNFPVPLIGYGVSPVIGYVLSVSYLEKNRMDCIK